MKLFFFYLIIMINYHKSCPEAGDFREDQCALFNNQPYEGSTYIWTAHYDDDNPCILTCKGKSANSEGMQIEDTVLVVAQLADKVYDGTRCRSGSLDMCIAGKCQMVGCDLRIGSTLQVDACGVCGGDGSSCARPLYEWTLTSMSLCSVTCGGGYKMSRPMCQNRLTGEEVEEQLCNESQKPDSTVVPCSLHNCPPKWHASEWGPCSVSCGGGSKLRQVHCVEEANNTKIRVNEFKCPGYKPRFQEVCNQLDCPTWHSSSWSGCSVSCGEGVQVRIVECRDATDQVSSLCPEDLKPTKSKSCSTGIQCPYEIDNSDEYLSGPPYHTQPLIQPYPPPAHAEKLVGEQIVPSESTFVPDEWGPCSVSCGEGTRKREVHCKIFLEFSRTIAKLPDQQCGSPKPMEIEKCFMEPCTSERIGMDVKDDPYRTDIKVGTGSSPGKSYSWKEQGYTHCSATCLGGVQELIVNCIRDDTKKVTSPYLCPIELKPEILMRTCNDHPCPPRWNYSEFSPCTQSCGIGIQTRDVQCIHEVTQGGGNTVIVPSNMCPQPPPPDRQYCNVLDCPVRWKLSDWSKCTKSCDGGEKSRKVECKQVMAQNHTVDRPYNMCPPPKPSDKKPCNTKSCIVDSDKPKIYVSNNTYIQHNVKTKKISLTVGGAATIFLGTTVKIKCPVKRYDRTKIQWLKDKVPIPKSKKYKTSKKGALRIQNLVLRDSGFYTCLAGKSSANIAISVRPKPGEFPTSEEIQQKGQKHDKIELISDVHVERSEGMPNFDDHSHEQRPDSPRKKVKSKPKLFTPTLPSLRLDSDMNHLNAWPPQSTTADTDNDQLLWPFQTFVNSRGHRMVAFPSQETTNGTSTTDPASNDGQMDENQDFGSSNILHNNPNEPDVEWVTNEWSKCSETCGNNGFQMRDVRCVMKLQNSTERVANNLCDDAGLTSPNLIRQCDREDCAKWQSSDWTPCQKSKCFKWKTALQKRVVKCVLGTNAKNTSTCNLRMKPKNRQDCDNEKCVGKWKVGTWSECTAGCEMHGVKYRILQCVWYGTKKPAGTACKDVPRPPVMKPCIGGQCTNTVSDCRDHSMFCPNVKTMNMCKISRYEQQCCQTCKG